MSALPGNTPPPGRVDMIVHPHRFIRCLPAVIVFAGAGLKIAPEWNREPR